ncbi:MAG: ABC transporter permease [bacterium]
MFNNYLKIAIRNLTKNKGYSFINVFGLSIGMAACILILLFVQDELSYDKFHENGDRIYRVTSQLGEANGFIHVALTQAALPLALKNDFPEIVATSVFAEGGDVVKYGDKTFVERFGFVQEDFFLMFSFKFLHGDPTTALSNPHSVVISESVAKKYFGDQDPIGQTLEVKDKFNVTVAGVIQDTDHSHIDLNMVLPFAQLKEYGRDIEDWDILNYTTYVMLRPGADHKQIEQKIANHLKVYDPEKTAVLHLQSLKDIYLHSDYAYDIRAKTSSADLVYILLIVAGLVLVIACINFMNLTTARSEKRIRETGLRKVFGAGRGQLIVQFMGEAFFLAFTALLLTFLLVQLALPVCNDLFEKQLTFEPFVQTGLAFGMLALCVITGLLSGAYPAFVFSSSKPSHALQRTLSGGVGKGRLRKALVVTQFACSIILIISTMGIYKQLRHIQNSALGYEKDHLVYIRNRDISENYQAYINQLLANPNILSVTASSNLPTWSWPGSTISEWDGNEIKKEFMMNTLWVNYDYFETYGMEMVSGRSFSREFPTDLTDALIVNEEAVRQMEMSEPISKRIFMSDYFKGPIIGVVKDFHFDNLRNKIKPLVIRLDDGQTNCIMIRVAPENITNTMAFLQKTGESFAVDFPVSYRFLDVALESLYRVERTTGRAALYFSALAISIASLGLFGLASFSTERRTKEIGVRKVLGASVPNVVGLLSREFTVLVVIAFAIAAPLAYFGLDQWLQSFANRTEIGFSSFAVAGLLALAITYLTVGYQSIKAALTNPTEALRHE